MSEIIKENKSFRCLSSFALHMIAMGFMLCDHLWATIVPGNEWLTWIGRMTFPIFAFMIVEGYFHTKDLKKYMKRLFVFALISEIPFNLMTSDVLIWPFQNNVMWTFLIALFCISRIDKVREKRKPVMAALVSACIVVLCCLLAIVTMVDYLAFGVLTVVVFYIFRGDAWWQRLGQLVGLIIINCFMIRGLVVEVNLFGVDFEIAQQSMAVLAIIPVWLYNGQRGPHNKWIQYGFYAFYPVHMLILGLL